METNKKLKAKDLINVGIYTAIYIVIFFVVGMLNAIPVLYPFLYVLIPLISGIGNAVKYCGTGCVDSVRMP